MDDVLERAEAGKRLARGLPPVYAGDYDAICRHFDALAAKIARQAERIRELEKDVVWAVKNGARTAMEPTQYDDRYSYVMVTLNSHKPVPCDGTSTQVLHAVRSVRTAVVEQAE